MLAHTPEFALQSAYCGRSTREVIVKPISRHADEMESTYGDLIG